jgi:nitrogenase iron protein NifH
MDTLRKKGAISEEGVVFEGFNGVKCAEVGGPEPGVGCAGRGIIVAVQALQKVSDALRESEVIIYDVPGDIVCGGFAVPITKGMVREAYIITSGEYMPLYAANNICRGLRTLHTPLSGIICNEREAEHEREIVEKFAAALGVPMLAYIPRDKIVQNCERAGKSVIEGEPKSAMAGVYRKLAGRILTEKDKKIPEALEDEDLRKLTQ